MNNKPNRNDYNDEEDNTPVGQLGFFTKIRKAHQHDVYLDEPFTESSYYRGVMQMLYEAGEDDIVAFHVASPGGLMSGLQSLVEAVKATEAFTIAVLEGECASAASMFAMYCDEICVTDSTSLLAHNVSYGTAGKGNDVLARTMHTTKVTEKFLRDTYEGFLSEEEILELLNGREIYFDADEVRQHLVNRNNYFEAKHRALEEVEVQPVKKVAAKKAASKKKAT